MGDRQRVMADVGEPVVTFLVGMRFNRIRSVRAWLPVFNAMPAMLRELRSNQELGMLNAQLYWSGRTITPVSYWRDFEALESYASNKDHAHRPAWTAFYRGSKASGGAVGIFHETYVVSPGAVESLYVNVPDTFGLAGAVGTIPVTGSLASARQRRDRDLDYPVATP